MYIYNIIGGYIQRCVVVRFFIKSIWILILLKLIESLDPFGLSSVTALYSKTLFYQWTSRQYIYEKTAEENPVSVVILRDESFEGTWPVKAIVHADILDGIKKLGPKAIFVDFAFIDNRNQEDETLNEELIPFIKKNVLESNCPANLYFLAITPTPDLTHGILPELARTGVKLTAAPLEDKEIPGWRWCFYYRSYVTGIFQQPVNRLLILSTPQVA